MINKIVHKKKILAIVIKKYRSKKGITFFTNPKGTQQIGYMKHKKNHIIQPHIHKKKLKKIMNTTEVLIILKGALRVDFYDNKKKYLFSKKIIKGEIIMLMDGGHGFKVLKNLEMIEVKQGPYGLSSDKHKFKLKDKKK